MGSLEELARKKFPDLSVAEERLVRAAPYGTVAICSDLGGDVEPEKADTWPASRNVRADLIRWLCVDREAGEQVDPKGVRIRGARITGALDLSYTNLLFPLFLLGCRLERDLNLRWAKMPLLNLAGSWTGAITADGLKLEGPIFLGSGFHAEDEVRLVGATIGGNLDATGGTFNNPKCGKNPNSTGYALRADGIKVSGSVFLRQESNAKDEVQNRFAARGEVRLHRAEVNGQLEVVDAWLDALDLDSAHITGPFLWQKIHRDHKEVSSGRCGKCSFFWRSIHKDHGDQKDRHPDFPDKKWEPSLNLTDTKVGPLADEKASWPEKGQLRLDGFVYDRIAAVPDAKVPSDAKLLSDAKVPSDAKVLIDANLLIDAKARLDWLHRQPDELGYLPQPYEQLIAVMRQMGYEDQVAEVGIAKKKDLHQRGGLGRWGKFWSWFLYLVVGYGYKPWWAFCWLALLVLIGTCVFSRAHAANVLVPSDKEAYQSNKTTAENTLPQFHALVYSLDIVLPFGLGQKAHFRLSEKPSGDFVYWIFELYSLFQLFAGWALWLVAAAVPAGFIKKD